MSWRRVVTERVTYVLVSHPTFMSTDDLPTIFDPATCVRKGLCPVTTIRGQGSDIFESHSLYFEQHGRGSDYKVVFIMGLNSSSFGWAPQVRHFGHSESHTVLVFDNRGVGNSGYPRGPYSYACVARQTADEWLTIEKNGRNG